MSGSIGFIQGRLSPLVEGQIQAFPWDHWRAEFPLAADLGFPIIEWTLDQENLHENPLMHQFGRQEIKRLCATNGVDVASVTGDFFMRAPFFKADPPARQARLDDLKAVIEACLDMEISYLVVPLVDNGSLEIPRHEDDLRDGLMSLYGFLGGGMKIVFESDFPPQRLAEFIASFPQESFGVNYDSGNSAALGFDVLEEFAAYADRIDNVHIKDRVRGGTTVPLGSGNVDFPGLFGALAGCAYKGNIILQTARAEDGDHAGALHRYREMTKAWMTEASS